MKQNCLFIAAVEMSGIFAQRSHWFIYPPVRPTSQSLSSVVAVSRLWWAEHAQKRPVVGWTCAEAALGWGGGWSWIEAAGGQWEKGAARTSVGRRPASTAPGRTGDTGI